MTNNYTFVFQEVDKEEIGFIVDQLQAVLMLDEACETSTFFELNEALKRVKENKYEMFIGYFIGAVRQIKDSENYTNLNADMSFKILLAALHDLDECFESCPTCTKDFESCKFAAENWLRSITDLMQQIIEKNVKN